VSVRLDPHVRDWLHSKSEDHLARINDTPSNLMDAEGRTDRGDSAIPNLKSETWDTSFRVEFAQCPGAQDQSAYGTNTGSLRRSLYAIRPVCLLKRSTLWAARIPV